MNIIICDDDFIFTKNLKEILEKILRKKSIETDFNLFQSGIDFYKWYQNHRVYQYKIDLIFMDIELPGLNGLDILKKYRELNKNTIIFIVSNYNSYVFDSFVISPFDYITKPIDVNKLEKSINRALKAYQTNNYKIKLNNGHQHFLLSYDDLIVIESSSKGIVLHTIYGDFTVNQKLSYLENQLTPFGFLKTHKSFIINMSKVIYYEKYQFHLINNLTADISFRRRAEIIKKFENYILEQYM